MKNKILILIILISIMCLTIACSNENAKLLDIEYDLTENNDNTLKNSTAFYDGAIQWLTEEYKYANRTSPLNGADDCPSTITNIIGNQEDFDKAFNEFPTEINFDEQMLVLHFFASNNIFADNGKRLRFYSLNNITQKEENIYFDICINKAELLISDDPYADATKPTHLCLAFVMPKMNVKKFEFEFEYKKYYYTWKGDLKSNTTLYNADLDWLRDKYKENNISELQYPDTLTYNIQNHEQFVSAFKKFYNNFDIEKEMLVLYFFKQDEDDKNIYEYSLKDVKFEYGYLDITLNKIVKETQNEDKTSDTGFLAIRLPQLPAYKINIKLN